MLVAVALAQGSQESDAARIFRDLGAADIERAEGTLVDGHWTDFDPLQPPALVPGEAGSSLRSCMMGGHVPAVR